MVSELTRGTKGLTERIRKARWERYQLIAFFYRSELLNKGPDCSLIDNNKDLGCDALLNLKLICQDYERIKKHIISLLKQGYTWESNFPLVRAILVVGCSLIERTDPPIIINELVEYTKTYVPGNFYKFINGVLDNYLKLIIRREDTSESGYETGNETETNQDS